MSVNAVDRNKLIRAIVIGSAVCIAAAAALLCLFALIMNMMSAIPYGIIDYAVIAAEGISVFAGAYTTAAIMKSRGLITGLVYAVVTIILTVISAMSAGVADIGLITLIRSAVLILCGIAGGILGVNKKEKLHIH